MSKQHSRRLDWWRFIWCEEGHWLETHVSDAVFRALLWLLVEMRRESLHPHTYTNTSITGCASK